MKKVFVVLVAIAMVATLLPLTVSSEDTTTIEETPHHTGITTTASVAGGSSGSPPIVKCKWETDKDATPGQIEPVLEGLNLEGVLEVKGRKIEVWLTNDERRIPVKVQMKITFGSIVAELVNSE